MPQHRVFITGVGVVSPLGNRLDRVFDRVYAGESGIVAMEAPEGKGPWVAALSDFDVGDVIPGIRRRMMARVSQMAVIAAHDALVDSGLEVGEELRDAGVYMGCGLGGAETMQDHCTRYGADPTKPSRAGTVPKIMANGPASHISITFSIRGPTVTYSIACASSTVAIGEAFRAVRHGYLSTVLAGGSEAQITGGTLSAWAALRVMATPHTDGPEASCRPFDVDRSGLVLGEGAAVLVLESEEVMRARGAMPRAEIVGYGIASDAHKLTEPTVEGQCRALRDAMADANISPEAFGYVNAHATGTIAGDLIEARAIREVFGKAANNLAVSSTKGSHGHLIGAAGALEAALTLHGLGTGRVLPTTNLSTLDPACEIDCVGAVGYQDAGLEYALSNSFAFGGTNATLALRRT